MMASKAGMPTFATPIALKNGLVDRSWYRFFQQLEQNANASISTTKSLRRSYNIQYSDNGTQFNNAGATGPITLFLPAWETNLRYAFFVASAHIMTIQANGTDTIRFTTLNVSSVNSNELYATIELTTSGIVGVWISTGVQGTWNHP